MFPKSSRLLSVTSVHGMTTLLLLTRCMAFSGLTLRFPPSPCLWQCSCTVSPVPHY